MTRSSQVSLAKEFDCHNSSKQSRSASYDASNACTGLAFLVRGRHKQARDLPAMQLKQGSICANCNATYICAGWQSWSGGDTSKQTPSTAAQPAQSSSQSIMASTLPNPDVNPLAIQPMTTPDVGGGNKRWINPTLSCNPWSGNSTLNGCITPQVGHQGTYCLPTSVESAAEDYQYCATHQT